MALDGDALLAAPGFPVTVVDTTGAGDVFRGGYIYGIVKGWSLERLLWFANAAAAVSCTTGRRHGRRAHAGRGGRSPGPAVVIRPGASPGLRGPEDERLECRPRFQEDP